MKIIKIMFFSMVKSFKLIVKTHVFDKYAGCVSERKNKQNTNNEIQILLQIDKIIDAKTMLNKVMPKQWKTVRTWIPKGSNI